jgi:hypothetical protein
MKDFDRGGPEAHRLIDGGLCLFLASIEPQIILHQRVC